MMRVSPAVRQQAASRSYRQITVPAPYKGWNTVQNPHNSNPNYASTLVNWWFGENCIEVRGGSSSYATRSAAGIVRSLYTHGTQKMWGFTDNGIYDVSSAGAYSAATQALSNGLWYGIIFTNPAGDQYLWGLNGTDSALHYNGTSWANPTITGVTSSTLTFPWSFKRRIFCIQAGTMNAWYLPTDSIAGEAKKFPIGALFVKGGELLSGFSWTLDGGNGPDDYCGFITSEGEVAIYQGTDPESASSWGLVGVFNIGRPAGRRCWIRMGADIYIATQIGLISLAAVVKGEVPTPQTALSGNIWTEWIRLWENGATSGNGRDAVHMVFHPKKGALLVNIAYNPFSGGTLQLVYNLVTRAWTRFDGWSSFHTIFRTLNIAGTVTEGLFCGNTAGGGEIDQLWTTANTDIGTVGINAIANQQGLQLAGGVGVLTTQVKPDLRLTSATSLVFCGNTLPSPYYNRWTNPYIAQPYQPGFYLDITMDITTSVGQTWRGSFVRYQIAPND